MGSSTPQPRFPEEIWDGTTPSTPDILTHKAGDVDFSARYRAEIIALEQTLNEYLELLEKIKNYGVGNSILGVKDDGTELEYKVLVEGFGVTITHGAGTITIATKDGSFSLNAVADLDVVVGTAVLMKSNEHIEPAQADTMMTAHVVGIATSNTLATETATYTSDGQVTRTDWIAVAGTALLTPSATYFLDAAAAGKITAVAPVTEGECVVRIGRALNINTLDVEIGWPICL